MAGAEESRYLRTKDVLRRFPISRVTLWRWVKAGAFPAPVHLGSSPTLFWRESDLLAWEAERAAARPQEEVQS